jgi:polyisoprenyl-phosphate glycosyltransferase
MKPEISNIEGPILVLGAGGFIGSNLLRMLRSVRDDVNGTLNVKLDGHARAFIELFKPRTIFDCVAYGGYSSQTDVGRIYQTNVTLKAELLELASEYHCTYIHAGSSSEYGDILDAPLESAKRKPHTHYAISKSAASDMIQYFGSYRALRCCSLRLYAVYGPNEPIKDRLMPQVVLNGLQGTYPPFVSPLITRDFIHVDDVCQAFVQAALKLSPEYYGESFNIGTGNETSIKHLAELAKYVFHIEKDPTFKAAWRPFDKEGVWRAQPDKAFDVLGWQYKVGLLEGLRKLKEFYRAKGN